MAANNYRAIEHTYIGNSILADTLCKNRYAHVAVTIEKFRLVPVEHQCKRCAAKLAKMDAIKARRAIA